MIQYIEEPEKRKSRPKKQQQPRGHFLDGCESKEEVLARLQKKFGTS